MVYITIKNLTTMATYLIISAILLFMVFPGMFIITLVANSIADNFNSRVADNIANTIGERLLGDFHVKVIILVMANFFFSFLGFMIYRLF